MSKFTSFAEKAVRPILITTVIGTMPALLLLVFGIFSTPAPNEPDSDLAVVIPVCLAVFSAIATFVLATTVAAVWYFIRRALERRELRRIGERFGGAHTLKVQPVLLACCAVLTTSGCAVSRESQAQAQAPPQRSIPLPKLADPVDVNAADGIDSKEAGFIASAYLAHYITLCGMPAEPVKQGQYWTAKLWTGITGTHFSGTLWISETTGEVVLQPPRKGFDEFEKRRLEYELKASEQDPSAIRSGLEQRVGQRVVLEGIVTNTKCPQVQGVDAWELEDYRGRRVRISGVLRKEVVTQADVDPTVANRGAGTFYSLDEMKYEILE